MKTLLSLLALSAFFAFSNSSLLAQSDKSAETLFSQDNLIKAEDIGYFIAPSFAFTQLDGSMASLFHLRSGISLKDKFSIGAYYSISMNEIKPESETIPNTYMDFWTVGGFIEYTLFSKKLIHLSIPVYVGYGEVEMDEEVNDLDFNEEKFFQIEPTLLLEINLMNNLRFDVGAGYRIITDMNYRNFTQDEISGLTAHIGLKVGIFN